MSSVAMTLEKAERAAAAKGCYVRLPKPNEIFIDIDSNEDYEVFEKGLTVLREFYEVSSVEETPSRSGGECRHVVVQLTGDNYLGDYERCLPQACLGSDRLHELLSLKAIKGGATLHPTLFFEVLPDKMELDSILPVGLRDDSC